MPENKKISQLPEFSSELASFPNFNIMVPIVKDGTTNYKLDIAVLISAIKSAIAEAAATGEEDDSGESGQEIDSQTLQNINDRINALSNRIQILESDNTWPNNYITLTDGNGNSTDYALPSGPNKSGYARGVIVIQTNSVTLPNFYATVASVSLSQSGTTATVSVSGSVANYKDTLQLEGGNIGIVSVSGTLYTSSGVFQLNGQEDNSSITLGKVSHESEPFSISMQVDNIPSGTTLTKVELTCQVHGVDLSGSASYTVSNQASLGTSGFITLPVSS